LTRRERWDRTDSILDQFGLNRVRKNNAARLSGGEKRRLEIARCLVCEPLLILLDEPFTGIDPKTIADIQEIVRDLRKSNIGILLTDHNVRETLKITDRSYLIKDGQVRTHGSPQEIIRDPIAINEYLGATFNDDSFGNIPLPADASSPVESVHIVVERERIHRLVEALKSDDHELAAGELLRRGGPAVISALLEALERRDVELRSQASTLLDRLTNGKVAYDPYAPEALRRQQLADLRNHFGKLAG
jgi:lipopolysaccharide export system ATP-binding protein